MGIPILSTIQQEMDSPGHYKTQSIILSVSMSGYGMIISPSYTCSCPVRVHARESLADLL